MEKTTLSKILEEVRTLARSEQAQLRGALDALLAEPEPSSAEEKVERLRVERGLFDAGHGMTGSPGPFSGARVRSASSCSRVGIRKRNRLLRGGMRQ